MLNLKKYPSLAPRSSLDEAFVVHPHESCTQRLDLCARVRKEEELKNKRFISIESILFSHHCKGITCEMKHPNSCSIFTGILWNYV